MNKNRLIYYGILSILIFVSIFLVFYFGSYLREYQARTFNSKPVIYIYPLMYIFIGILIGIEYWYKQRKIKGKWMIRRERLIFLGIPSFIMTFHLVLLFDVFNKPFLPANLHHLLSDNRSYFVGGILLGFILITSFKKTEA
jgi:membrane protease YdiL (CAAX protease family)